MVIGRDGRRPERANGGWLKKGRDGAANPGKNRRGGGWRQKAVLRIGEKKALNLWVLIELIHTFASPFEKWELAYVSTNQNQITVLRSQSGG